MRKINNKKSLVLGDGNGNYVPNIIRGGNAIPLGNNFYYIKGRKHSAGGVDIGADPKTGLEVEGEEVMKVTPKEVRVYSSVPFLQGNSPAELVMGGANPDAVFNAQEEFKDRNRINDDGTKYQTGGNKKLSPEEKLNIALGRTSDGRPKEKGLVNVSPEFDILTGIRGLINTGYKLTLPKDADRYYRIVGKSSDKSKDAIADAIESGVIRTKRKNKTIVLANGKTVQLGKQFDYPMFSKGQPWKGSNAAGTKNVNYIVSKKGNSPIKWEESNIDFNHKNHAGIFRPNYNGDLNSAPAEYFEYYKSLPFNLGYIKSNFKYGGNKKPLGGNLSTNQNDFLDTWNASRLATGRYNNQLGEGRLERQAESRNTAREFHSPIGFAMNYGKRAAIRTPSMSDTDYRKEIARNAQSMKLRLNTPESGQGVIGGAYHAPTHSSYINQEEFAKDPTVRTHENAHASRATEQEQVISDILGSSSSSTYLRRPTEVYSRLMQFRQANNLDPNTIYDKDSFRELRKTATDYNLINTFKEDEVIDLLNNVAMRNDPNQLNLNNINLNTVPVYAAKYGTKRKSKMGKVISINGNVRNGLIHTPSREAFAYGGERKPRFNGRYSKPGLHNLSLLASAIFLPKGTIDKEPDKPRRIGWVDAHNRLVGADISQKPLDAKQDNTSVAHVISEREKRTRKFAAGGRKKAKAGKDTIQADSIPVRYYIPLDKANLSEAGLIDFAKYARVENENKPAGIRLPKSSLVAPKNIVHNEPTIAKVADFPFDGSINAKSISRAERNVGARGKLNTEENGYNKIEELLNRVRELGTDAQGKNDTPMTFNEYTNPQANYAYDYASRNNRSIANLNRLGITPRLYGNPNRVNASVDTNIPATETTDKVIDKTVNKAVNATNKNVSSSTGGDSDKSVIPATRTFDGSKVTTASNAEMAGITRGLAPTIVNRLAKNVNNDINHLSILDNLKRPYQEDIAKTRNLDNIQFGINLGSSVIDALMGNIFANQLHSYTPPTITAPVISNPGEIKLNEEDLKDIPEPILMAAAKLKTRYNANPQLAKIEDETRRTMRDIDRNTSNSRVGLARKQLAALRGQEAKNQVYAQKENIETELINKDKLNQQEVTARNLARYDQYNQALAAQMANRARLRLAADTANIQNKLAVSTANANLKAQADQFNAGNRINSLIHKAGIDGAKAEARANIVSNLLGNVGSAFDIWNRNKRQARLDEETLKVLGLRAPNVNKLILRAIGINE